MGYGLWNAVRRGGGADFRMPERPRLLSTRVRAKAIKAGAGAQKNESSSVGLVIFSEYVDEQWRKW